MRSGILWRLAGFAVGVALPMAASAQTWAPPQLVRASLGQAQLVRAQLQWNNGGLAPIPTPGTLSAPASSGGATVAGAAMAPNAAGVSQAAPILQPTASAQADYVTAPVIGATALQTAVPLGGDAGFGMIPVLRLPLLSRVSLSRTQLALPQLQFTSGPTPAALVAGTSATPPTVSAEQPQANSAPLLPQFITPAMLQPAATVLPPTVTPTLSPLSPQKTPSR